MLGLYTMKYKEIILPGNFQTDTILAFFLLKKFGNKKGISISDDFKISISPILKEGENFESFSEKGILSFDVGGGPFDHHGKEKMTVTKLVIEHLEILKEPAISKILALAERDDFFGKGTLSEDVLDRSFGLPMIIGNLNRLFSSQPEKVFTTLEPVLESHYTDERRRDVEIPELVEKLKRKEKIKLFIGKNEDKKVKIISFESGDSSLSGYFRSYKGGKYDVTIQFLETGHINVITRQDSKINLVPLVKIVRSSELFLSQKEKISKELLEGKGRIIEIPEWYYDTATNSLLNGGLNPGLTPATKIPIETFKKILSIVFEK